MKRIGLALVMLSCTPAVRPPPVQVEVPPSPRVEGRPAPTPDPPSCTLHYTGGLEKDLPCVAYGHTATLHESTLFFVTVEAKITPSTDFALVTVMFVDHTPAPGLQPSTLYNGSALVKVGDTTWEAVMPSTRDTTAPRNAIRFVLDSLEPPEPDEKRTAVHGVIDAAMGPVTDAAVPLGTVTLRARF